MPIECKFRVERIDKALFHAIDYKIMGHAFDVHNELGFLCDEAVYQSAIYSRCVADGLNGVTEGEIVVSLDSFKKSYYVDAVFCENALYEFKAVRGIDADHEAQLLNYMFLSGASEGKLVNFGASSVTHRFVSTTITTEDRYKFAVLDQDFDLRSDLNQTLHRIVNMILQEWGAFLDINLYRAAIIHFLGGEEKMLMPVDFFLEGRSVGHQLMCLPFKGIGVHVSSVIKNPEGYRKQLVRMLSHSNLEQLQWINFSRDKVRLITLKK
jgi:GxxExxY protein